MKKRSTRTETHPKRVQSAFRSQSQTFPSQKHEIHNQRKLTSCKSNLYEKLSVFNVLLPTHLSEPRHSFKKGHASGDCSVKRKSHPKLSSELKTKKNLTLYRKMGDEGDAPPEEVAEEAPAEGEEGEAPEAAEEGAEEGDATKDEPPEAPGGESDKEHKETGSPALSNVPSVDSAVLEELRNADAKAAKTSKLIESMKQDIMKLQQKKDMTEEDLKNLRNMHDALNAKLSEFEDIAKKIQKLLGMTELTPSKLALAKAMPSFEPPSKKSDVQEIRKSGEPARERKSEGKQEQVHLTSSEEEKLKELEDKLPKVIICGTGKEGEVPKIIVCEPVKRDEEVTRKLTDKLSESYKMQEKLVEDNAKMEGSRYELQEELLSRDKAVESLQKQVESLQKEMKLIARENAELKTKMMSLTRPSSPTCKKFMGASDWDTSSNKDMEKKIEEMEDAVRSVKDEIGSVQTERKMLKTQTQMLQCAFSHQPVCQKEIAKQHQLGIETSMCIKELEGRFRELSERYNTLDENYNDKISEIACLRTELKNERIEIENLAERCCFAEARADDLLERLRMVEIEKQNACIARDQFIDMEQQLVIAKQQLQNLKEEKESLEIIKQELTEQVEDYSKKYLDAQQVVEEQRRTIERLQVQCCEIKEKLLFEVNAFKNQIQEKLNELAPLPDKLRMCETKLLFSQQNIDELTKELVELREINDQLMASVTCDELRSEKENLLVELSERDNKIEELKADITGLKATLTRFEELTQKAEWDYEEKLNEVTQLSTQLATVREESARQVVKTKERCETVRKLMLGQISTLEKQLAESRAASAAASKERDEIRAKMQQQVSNLGDNFNQAQMRIKTLQDHINYMKASPTY